MNIVVLGAGAIGSVFGGLLALAGHQVTLIGRHKHMKAIAERGLFIDGIWGEHCVTSLACFTSVAEMPLDVRACCELALVTVKSYDTDELMRGCVGLLPGTVTFVSLQNGLGNIECILRHAGFSRVIGGRIIFGVVFVENGHVRVTVEADSTALGVPKGGTADMAHVEHCARMFSQAGIRCRVAEGIEMLLWGKMLYNCALNALATILNTHYGSLLETGMHNVMLRIVEEIFTVASLVGVELPYPSPDDYIHILCEEQIPRTYDHVPSMLQDIQRGKKTEIQALNGYIVNVAQQYNCPVPCNSVVAAMVEALEMKRAGDF
jgi:2-dehydropantoate 2-reductase